MDIKTPKYLSNELYIFGFMTSLITLIKFNNRIDSNSIFKCISFSNIEEDTNKDINHEFFH